MAEMQEMICKCGCGQKKMVRAADVRRGWGKFFSKSCKAKWQEKRTGQHRAYLKGDGWRKDIRTVDGVEVGADFVGMTDQENDAAMADAESGWDGHKGWV